MAGETLKGLVATVDQLEVANPFRVETKNLNCLSQGFKANPGLELANTFGVRSFPQITMPRMLTPSCN